MNVYRNVCSLMSESDVDIVTNFDWKLVTKNRFVDEKSNHMFCRVDSSEVIQNLNVKELSLDQYEYVIISDYDKGFISSDDIEYICHHHHDVFLDTKKPLGSWAKETKFIKINNFEADRSKSIVNELDKKVIQTIGSDGAIWNGKVFPVKDKVETLDVSGAGDTFLASLVVRYSKDRDIVSSINYANSMASKVVSKRGTSVP